MKSTHMVVSIYLEYISLSPHIPKLSYDKPKASLSETFQTFCSLLVPSAPRNSFSFTLALVIIAFSQVYLSWYKDGFSRTISHSKYFPSLFLHQHSSLLVSFWWKTTSEPLLIPALQTLWCTTDPAVKYRAYASREALLHKWKQNKTKQPTHSNPNQQSSMSRNFYTKVIPRKEQFT